jgi:formylglycine-generating enzyme required for sulfatase activity
VAAVGLAVHFVNTGETVNAVAEPVIARVLTLAPLPTPTLGAGSVQVSPADGMRMAYVPAGEFTMGSNDFDDDEQPAHRVHMDSFWIDQYEVTNGMYAKCVEAGVCNPPISDAMFSTGYHLDFEALRDAFSRRVAENPGFSSQPVTNVF